MFCHYCGKKLVAGARFCSWCSTPIPPEILEEMARDANSAKAKSVDIQMTPSTIDTIPTNDTELVDKPELDLIPEPVPENNQKVMPESELLSDSIIEAGQNLGLGSTSMPELETSSVLEIPNEQDFDSEDKPEHTAESVSMIEPQIKPEPIPETEQEPICESIPKETHKLESECIVEHDPVAESTPIHKPEAEVQSVSLPEPDLPEEKLIIPLTVSAEQIQKEESIILKREALLEPMQLTLRKGMKDGMHFRLTNAKVKPASSGAKQIVEVHLHIQSSAVSKPEPDHLENKVSANSSAPKDDQNKPSASYQPTVIQQPPARKTVSFKPVSFLCGFQFCTQDKLKKGYHFGGTDDDGTIEIEPAKISVYKKSKLVGATFGAIGSAIEGRGKFITSVSPGDISSFEKETKKHKAYEYRIYLKDKWLLKITLAGSRIDAYLSALDQFLTQI